MQWPLSFPAASHKGAAGDWERSAKKQSSLLPLQPRVRLIASSKHIYSLWFRLCGMPNLLCGIAGKQLKVDRMKSWTPYWCAHLPAARNTRGRLTISVKVLIRKALHQHLHLHGTSADKPAECSPVHRSCLTCSNPSTRVEASLRVPASGICILILVSCSQLQELEMPLLCKLSGIHLFFQKLVLRGETVLNYYKNCIKF